MTGKKAGIHISSDGFEYDRIVIPMFKKYPVEKLIILRSNSSPYTDAMDLAGKFLQKIMDTPVDVELVSVDIYDFNEVFVNTLALIKKYASEGKKIYINLSPVPKLATVAMISAAFLSEYKGQVEIFYATPEEYLTPKMIDLLASVEKHENDDSELSKLHELFMEKGTAVGVKDYMEIPVFPIKDITDMDQEILQVLKDTSGVNSIESMVNAVNRERKEKITRSSIQYRLERLEANGLVDTEREERRLKIRLNKLGEVYLESSLI